MKKRLLTSAVLLSIAYLLMFVLAPIYYLIFLYIVSMIVCFEISDIYFSKSIPIPKLIFCFCLNTCLFAFSYFCFKNNFEKPWNALLLLLALPVILAAFEMFKQKLLFKNKNWLFMFRVSCITSISLPILSVLLEKDIKLLAVCLFSIWITDTAALFFGKCFGKTPLSTFSPNKTLEGSIYSNIFCCFLALASVFLFKFTWYLIPIVFFINILAQIGDLHESLVKRTFKVKNSGNLLPGHGGFYDRCDSILLASPFFFLLAPLL